MRRARWGALATLMDGSAAPYASLVTVAWDLDARPILLLSDLADHTRNLRADARVSLLVEAASGLANPQAGPRVTLVGRVARSGEERHARRFLARHPAARAYAGFDDFRFHVMDVEGAHFVAGFGEVLWLDGAEVMLGESACSGIAACEQDVIEHMNRDHADAVALYATVLLGKRGKAWKMVGIDPEGADLRLRDSFARLVFEGSVRDAGSCRKALVGLAAAARARRR